MTTSDSSGQCTQLKEKGDAHHTTTTSAQDPHVGETEGGLLLEGSYDEAASAAAFQQALAEWRKGEKGSNSSDELNTNKQQQHVPIESKYWDNPLLFIQEITHAYTHMHTHSDYIVGSMEL